MTENNGNDPTAVARDWIRAILDSARELFVQTGEMRPVAFFMATRNPVTGQTEEGNLILPIPIACFDAKDELVSDLVRLSRYTRAIGVAIVHEAWFVFDPAGISHAQEHGTLATYAQRREALTVVFEHVSLGCEIWLAEIHREADSVRLDAWQKQPQTTLEGRFVALLDPSAYGPVRGEA